MSKQTDNGTIRLPQSVQKRLVELGEQLQQAEEQMKPIEEQWLQVNTQALTLQTRLLSMKSAMDSLRTARTVILEGFLLGKNKSTDLDYVLSEDGKELKIKTD